MKDNSIFRLKLDPPSLEVDEELDDEALFRKLMADVKPLSGRKSRKVPRPGRNGPKGPPRQEPPPPEELLEESLREMENLESFLHPEYIEGGSGRWDRRLLKKLREGGFSVQAELDLHGYYQEEARRRVEEFIQSCSERHLTCVRIVHGRGRNSRNQVPVLKGKVQQWLSIRRLSQYVVAYTSARPVDGGVGAIYVLLKRSRRRKRSP